MSSKSFESIRNKNTKSKMHDLFKTINDHNFNKVDLSNKEHLLERI